MIMSRAALIDQIQQARETLPKLLTLLQSTPVERDRFVSHLYQSRQKFGGRAKRLGNQESKSSDAGIARFQCPAAELDNPLETSTSLALATPRRAFFFRT